MGRPVALAHLLTEAGLRPALARRVAAALDLLPSGATSDDVAGALLRWKCRIRVAAWEDAFETASRDRRNGVTRGSTRDGGVETSCAQAYPSDIPPQEECPFDPDPDPHMERMDGTTGDVGHPAAARLLRSAGSTQPVRDLPPLTYEPDPTELADHTGGPSADPGDSQ